MERKGKINSNTNLTIVDKKIYPVYNPLTNKIKRNSIANLGPIFTEYKTLSQQNVIAILSKNKKVRMDIENRRVGEYLSRKFEYFKKIKDNNNNAYLRLIPALKFDTVQADEIIINIGDENNNIYIIFEGSVKVYKESKHLKKWKLIDIRNYLKNLNNIDNEKYKYTIKKNKNIDIDFDKLINDDSSYKKSNNILYEFYYEELEDMGTYSEGFSFGEANFVNKTNRELIIKSLTNCKLIYINKFDYNRLLKTTEEKALEKKADNFKKKFPLFKSWTMEQLFQLFNSFIYELHFKGEYIYKQNDENEYLYFIEEGAIIQYASISFSWYNEYIDYIKNFNPNLLDILLKLKNTDKKNEIINNDVNGYLLEQIENIKIENKNNKGKYPFLNIDKIYMKRKKDLGKINELLSKDINKENFIKIKYEENEINSHEKLYKIPILNSKESTILGLEDAFEIKNKLTTVGCISEQVNLKKIKIIDLLNILYSYKEYDYIETFIEIMIKKKSILSEAIKSQIKKYGIKFEDNMQDKYQKIISQPNIILKKGKNYYIDEKKRDAAIVSLRLKGWNNGLYLDNILDTNLFLWKPKNKKKIKEEETKKCKTLNYLYNVKSINNNEKNFYSTKVSFDRIQQNKQILVLKNLKSNKIKSKLLNMKSVSIKNDKLIKNFFKTNIPSNEEKLRSKISKENIGKNIKFRNENKKQEIVNTSPIKNIFKKNKTNLFNKYKNYKISEDNDEETNNEKNLNIFDDNNFPYISNSIFNTKRYYNCIPSILYK
jgi:CRP-like cAMP-binding protein